MVAQIAQRIAQRKAMLQRVAPHTVVFASVVGWHLNRGAAGSTGEVDYGSPAGGKFQFGL